MAERAFNRIHEMTQGVVVDIVDGRLRIEDLDLAQDFLDHRLGLIALYRYFRRGGIYRSFPKSRRGAAWIALAYWRKGSRG